MKLHNFQLPRLKKGRSRVAVIAWAVSLAGGSIIALAREMVAIIHCAPFPDAIERWGRDGYSHLEDLIVLGGWFLPWSFRVWLRFSVGWSPSSARNFLVGLPDLRR